jgi:predicted GH43/DUF377 family glycosyl hydrolase
MNHRADDSPLRHGTTRTQAANYKRIFHREKQNPIVSALDLPYDAAAVFNPAVTEHDGGVCLLMRVEDMNGFSNIYAAFSPNGVDDWQFEQEPFLQYGLPENRYEAWGCEDPRITYVAEEGCWYITYVAVSPMGPAVALARSHDLRRAERLALVGPNNDKDGVLFPERIKDRWLLFHRPDLSTSEHIWSAYSPDLIHWGEPHSVLREGDGPAWDSRKVGAGAPPVRVDDGWLLIYHGVKGYGGELVYRVGVALFDLERPHKCIARASDWVLQAEADYELTGVAPNVIFPTGVLLRGDELWMYYGAADTYVCLARAKIGDVMEALSR